LAHIIIIITNNEEIRVTLCENAAGALYIQLMQNVAIDNLPDWASPGNWLGPEGHADNDLGHFFRDAMLSSFKSSTTLKKLLFWKAVSVTLA